MKLYLIGFIKGLGVLVIILAIYVILSLIAKTFELNYVRKSTTGIYLVTGHLFTFYLVFKFKLEKYWNIFVLLTGVVSIPFLYGIREMKKSN